MTKPDDPDPAEVNDQPAPVADEAGHPPGGAETEVLAAQRAGSGDLSEEPARAAPAAGTPTPEGPPKEPAAEDSAPGEQPGDGSVNGSTTAVPPVPAWQRAGTPAADGGRSTVRLQVDELEPSSGTDRAKTDQQRPIGRAYGYSSSSGPGPAAASTRYGQPAAQSFNAQPSRGAGQDFTGPTVRIGGRVPAEQVSSQPSLSTRIRPTRIPRRTTLQLRYLEPWSVLKVSLVLSVAGFLAWMVAVGVLYNVLGNMGVWDQLNGTYSDLTSVRDPQAGQDLITAGGVFGVAFVIGLVNIVLITAMCTVGAFIYNASADLAGGIEVTLSERD